MKEHDQIDTLSGKKALYRIYRDTSFSLDKTPYKTNWSGSFHRMCEQRRCSYYFHFEPGGKSVVAGGFWGPTPDELKLSGMGSPSMTNPFELSLIQSKSNAFQ